MTNNDIRDFKDTAVLLYPVVWAGPAPVEDIHSTFLWLGDITDVGYNAHDVLGITQHFNTSEYRSVKVTGTDYFGENKDVPVLLLDDTALRPFYDALTASLSAVGIKSASEFGYVPHVTVDPPTVLLPPSRVLLAPLELWWQDIRVTA